MKKILFLTEKPSNIKNETTESVVVATKSVYLFTNFISEKFQVISLENEKVMPYNEVYNILKEINGCIKKTVGDERAWVYEAGYLIEGTRLAQYISDVLSGMEVVTQIFEKYSIERVVLCPSGANLIECMLVKKVALEKNIKVEMKYEGVVNFLVTANSGVVYGIKCIRYVINAFVRYVTLMQKAKKKNHQNQEYQIGLIIIGNSKKYIEWLKPLACGIKENFKSYKVMCLNGSRTAEYFNDIGYSCDCMEEWVNKETLKKRKKEYIRLLYKLHKAIRKEFICNYNGYDITEILIYYVSVYLLTDVPRNLEIDSICHDYFSKNKFSAVSTYGDSCCVETRAEHFNTRENKTKLFRIEGLKLFHLPRYEEYADIIDIRFMSPGAARYEELIEQGWKGHAYFINDVLYTSKLQNRKSEENVGRNENLTVLWAPSYVLGGYTTYSTFEYNNRNILKKFEENNWKLYVKFHPGQLEAQVEELYYQYKESDNIIFIDKKESIYEWIEKVDVIITDKSLLIFDGIVLEKPVMAICSSYHYYLIGRHEEGVQIYQNIEQMFQLLESIEKNREYFEKWKEVVLRQQKKYLNGLMKDSNPIDDIVEILKKECLI